MVRHRPNHSREHTLSGIFLPPLASLGLHALGTSITLLGECRYAFDSHWASGEPPAVQHPASRIA
jgi:hypothetical protein